MTQQIQIIGEAARAISQEFRDRTPDVPWSDIIGMRHVLVHQYFQIDLDIMWHVIISDLPKLKARVQELANELEREV